MPNVGIICDLSFSRHHLFHSYYHAVRNTFGAAPATITNARQLDGIDILVIGDDHYDLHKNIWQAPGFIDECNDLDIVVIVLTNEKILHSHFPWNTPNYELLTKFKCLFHYTIDVEDCHELGLRLNRTAPSSFFASEFPEVVEKKDKVVFIGKLRCSMNSYRERNVVLREIRRIIEVDVIESVPTWKEYLNVIAGYRFVLSPIGNGNFFPMRFYEALAVHSIPIHQVRANTLELYDIERGFDDCIYFEHAEEVKEKIQDCTLQRSHNVIWMEDNLQRMLILDKLIPNGKV